MIKNVLDYLYNSKEKYPLKTAVADDKSSMTYTELVDNATAIAAGLSEYVGVSRAKERCYHLGEIRTVNMALKKKENFDRKTLLLTLLNQ